MRVSSQKYKVDLVCLIETKVKLQNEKIVFPSIFSGKGFCINNHSHPIGRIIVAWRPQAYAMEVVVSTDQVMHCRLHQHSLKHSFLMTFVYGYSKALEREAS